MIITSLPKRKKKREKKKIRKEKKIPSTSLRYLGKIKLSALPFESRSKYTCTENIEDGMQKAEELDIIGEKKKIEKKKTAAGQPAIPPRLSVRKIG